MKLDKSIIAILIIILLSCIGGVYASDNQTSTDVVAVDAGSDVDEMSVDAESVDNRVSYA